ncbi:efflux RND transporter periplasmic adaptor subunit [Ramlibacter humi]|uniref:Efflux RND transporter periplasmic adaptor subunit n=1 Tax=Ramlibacter humi TaxID=2530451 RepID=A0A4Z0BSP9_9BURK|nr:efflux RND transporter periplasmic adaptor subunit [Ramlibacter humi]TFZ01762.1 efflux RND transporter periplasmic adaptor subunit [Ramlibacter humi]
MAENAPSAAAAPQRNPLRWLLWLAAALAVGAAVYWLGWARPHEADGAAGRRARASNAPTPVATATVTRQTIRSTLNALGTVTPVDTVTVQAQVSGQLTQVAFTEGRTVRRGDFLAQIDPRPYEAALAQAQGQLLKDQAMLGQARMDLVRYQQLAEKNSINRQQAEDQKWVVQQDEGVVKVDEAQVQTARINLGYCRIVAPTDGRIGLRLVDPGNLVQTGASATGLAVITRMQPMSVVFVLPEDSLAVVLARQHAGAALPVQAYDRSGTRLLDTGALQAIDSQINTSTGTVNLKAQFPNEAGNLFPNQFVNVVLRVDEQQDAVAVPTAAVQRGSNGSFAYRVDGDGKVAVAPVQLGPVDGERAAVISGLQPGDEVVVDGADKLRDGARVSLRNAAAH